MRTSQFSEKQILDILKQGDAGQKVGEVCRGHGISEGTYYRWKAKYGGVDASQLQRLRQLEDENGRLKRIVADLTLDPPISTGDLAGPPSLDDDWLVLSTVHSAKGGEWDVVHVIHAADGMFPSDLSTGDAEAIAEERRLFYVALTRARDVLEVSAPLRYHHHPRRLDDRHSYAPVSRFLSPAVVSLMEPRHAGPPGGHTLVGHEHPGGDIDPGVQAAGVAAVDALLAELWS